MCPVFTEYSPPKPKFYSVSLYDQPFLRYTVVENQKCTKWPHNDLEHLTVESTLHTLNTHPRGPNLIPFRSTASRFRDTRLLKIGNAPNNPRMTLSTLLSNISLYVMNTHPQGPNFTQFRSTTNRFWDTCTSLSKIRNPPNDLRMILSTCIHWILTPRPKFYPVSLYGQPFSRNKLVENRKCTEWPENDIEHLTVKSTLYTLQNTHLWGSNFIPFRSRTSHFRDIGLLKIRNDTRMTLST